MSAPSPRNPDITYETKVLNLIVQDRADKKKYERMLAEGWEVEDVVKRTLLRGATYSFRRPKRQQPEDPLAGWAKKKLKQLDQWSDVKAEEMRADSKRMKAERLEERAAKKEQKAERKAGNKKN